VSPNNPQAQHVVTAVIVAHDGAAWIPRATEALLNQTRQLQRVVAVDTGSRDRSGAVLAESLGRAAVFGMDRGTGYAAAVAQALRHRAANTHLPPTAGAPGEQTEWVWLLHDDCEPEPDALEHLLLGAEQVPAAAVLGPKLMDWSDRDVLLEAGAGIDRVGRRITGIEPREVDQGQHDGDRDVLAVSSAGMLVRRDVWDEVGGFDPGMMLYREDVDFCWRVQAAGYRVRVITDAVMYHVEASARNRRQASAAPRRGRQDRRNGLLVLFGNLPAGPMLSALAGNLVLSALRTLFYLVAKRPGAALDEVAAVAGVVGHPLRLLTARRRRSHGRRAAYSRLRADVPAGRSLRRLAEFATGALSKKLPVDMVGSHHATDDPTDDDSLLVDTGLVQRLLTNPGVLLFLVLTAITLVAERSLLSTNPLGGGALVPAWGGASGLWSEYLQGFHPAGIGSAASAPPFVAVIAALATLLGGKPWLAVDVILIGCVPLAGVTAYLASRRITRFVPVRIWAAMAYALLPVGMGAVAAGRLGTALVLVVLPLIAVMAARVFTHGPRRARRAAWAAALAIAVVTAFVPLVWVIAVVAMALGALAFGRRRPQVVVNAGIVAVVPMVLLLPWSAALMAHPSRLLLEAGLQPPGLTGTGLTARSLLLLSPGGPGLPPYWVTGGLALTAAVALLVSTRRTPVLTGWTAAAVGLLIAAGLSKVVVMPAAGGAPSPAWPGIALMFAGAGLLLAALAAGDSLPAQLGGGRWRAPAGLAVVALAAVACTAPVLAAATWVTSGVRGPVRPAAGPVLPEIVSVFSTTGLRPRTLVLRAGPHGSVAYSVLRDADPLIGANELIAPPAARRPLDLSVAALTAPYGSAAQDQGQSLAQFGIGYVLMPAPVSPALARLLDGVPGLRSVSQTAAFRLWRVSDTAARVRVLGPGGTVVPIRSGTVGVSGAKAPTAGGTLVLAEPAGGWSASLNGQPLTPLASPVGGWAQGFHLPAGGGSLTVSHSDLGRILAVALECLAVAAVVGLGLPGARVAGDAEEQAPAAAARRRGGRIRDNAHGRAREKSSKAREKIRAHAPARRGRGQPDGAPGLPGRQPLVPASGDVRLRGPAAAGVRGGPPAASAAAEETAFFPAGPNDQAMVSRGRGRQARPGLAGGPAPAGGRGYPDGRGGHARRDAGPDAGWPQPERSPQPEPAGRPGYEPVASGRDGRPEYDDSAAGSWPGYAQDPGRGGRPGSGPGPGAGRGEQPYDAGRDAGRDTGSWPGYAQDPGRGGRPGPDPGPGAGRGGQPYDAGRDTGSWPGYAQDPGGGRPVRGPGPGTGRGGGQPYDPGRGGGQPYDPGRGGGQPYDPGRGGGQPYDSGRGAGRGGGQPYDPGRDAGSWPGYAQDPGRGRPVRGPDPVREADPGRGRPGYPPDGGRNPDAGRGRPGYDPDRTGGARPGHEQVPGRGGTHGNDSGPVRGGQRPSDGPPEPAPTRDSRWRRAGRSGRRSGRSGRETPPGRSPATRDGRSGQGVPRGRLPGGNEALSPLPPLPPRGRRPMDGYADRGGPPDWQPEPPHDPGESDW
jgi:GT2 family glycosyltransferase